MLRSYDHRKPNVISKAKKTRESPVDEPHRLPLEACNLPLWRVGRATSAAPTYFSPYHIGKDLHRDGGAGGANNPVKHAYNEVRQMHSQHYPRLIISIGTGVQREREYGRKSGIVAFLSDPSGVLSDFENDYKQSILDAEKQHEEFSRTIEQENLLSIKNKNAGLADRGKHIRRDERAPKVEKGDKLQKSGKAEPIAYVRFNVPVEEEFGEADLTSVKLGDWKGAEGTETRAIMEAAVNKYLESQQDKLDRCARILVNVRHERQKTVRWESFALHMAYHCPESCQELEFDSRRKLRKHLERDHGFVWQVPCKDRRRQSVAEPSGWSCFRDECGETQVSVFDSIDDFKAHMRRDHGIEKPRVVNQEDLEKILDRGRKVKQPRTMSPHTTFNSRKQSMLLNRQSSLMHRISTRRTNSTIMR